MHHCQTSALGHTGLKRDICQIWIKCLRVASTENKRNVTEAFNIMMQHHLEDQMCRVGHVSSQGVSGCWHEDDMASDERDGSTSLLADTLSTVW